MPGSKRNRTEAPLTPTASRARENDPKVVRILKAMSTGRWVAGRSHQELAEEYGDSVRTIRYLADQAGRMLRILTMANREDLVARNVAHLEAIAADAHEMDDFGAAVRAREAMARLLGLNAPERVQVSASADYDSMPIVEQIRWLRDKASELLAEADRKEREAGIVDMK